MSGEIHWDKQLMDSMMFLYQTRKCPLNKKNICKYGNLCFDSHDDQQRRRPLEQYGGHWNYDPNDVCTLRGTKWQDNQCRNYPKRCNKSHSNDEMNYHPTQYKIRRCTDTQYNSTRICSRGPRCWGWHDDQNDNRTNAYIDKNIAATGLTKHSKPPSAYLNWAEQQINNNSNNNQNRKLPPDAFQHNTIEREIKYNNNHSFGNNFKSQDMNQHNSNQQNLNQPSRNKRGPPPPNMNDNGNMNSNNNNMNGNDVRNYNNNNNMNGNNQSNDQRQSSLNHMNNSQPINNNNNNNDHNMNQNERQKPQNPPHLQSNSQIQVESFENEQKYQEPKSNGKRNGTVVEQHNAWKERIAKDYLLFKFQKCENGMNCEKGINCARWHGPHDKRRDVGNDINKECPYSPAPCPNLFDFHGTEDFDYNLKCPQGDNCSFAHNRIEMGFHPKCYKTVTCPYFFLSGATYDNPQCPFERSREWFEEYFGKENIKKVKRTTVYLKNGLHLALDYCPFAHHIEQRRYEDDPPIIYNQDKKNKDKNESKPIRNDPPHHSQSNSSNHLQQSSSTSINRIPLSSNQSVSSNHRGPIPPHEMSANPHPSPNPPPSHHSQHSHHSYQNRPASNAPNVPPSHQSNQSRYSAQRAPSNSNASMNNNNNSNNNNNNNNNTSYRAPTNQGPSKADLQQLASENAEWEDQNKDDDDW